MSGDWIADSVMGFLGSPLWQVPIQTFIENNCIVFDTEEEHKLEYTIIHAKYKELIESLLENFLADLEISPTQFSKIMATDFDMSGTLKQAMTTAAMSISAAENYLLFRNMMTGQNLKFEAEVMAAFESGGYSGPGAAPAVAPAAADSEREGAPPAYTPDTFSGVGADASMSPDHITEEDRLLEEALQLSRMEYNEARNHSDGFDEAELTQALEASRIDHEKMLARIKDQEAATLKAMQTSLKDAPKLKPAKKKTKAKKGDSPAPPAGLPKLNMAHTLAAATSEPWICEAARTEASVGGMAPAPAAPSAAKPASPRPALQSASATAAAAAADSRQKHYDALRERLRQKHNSDREEQLSRFTADERRKSQGKYDFQPNAAAVAAHAPDGLDPSAAAKKKTGGAPTLTGALALRLKQEVIKKGGK